MAKDTQELLDLREEVIELRENNTEFDKENSKLNRQVVRLTDETDEQEVLITEIKNEAKRDRDTLNQDIIDITKKMVTEQKKNIKNDTAVQLLTAQLSNANQEIKDVKRTLEEYRKLPDLSNMIKNLETLSTPSMDKLTTLVQSVDKIDEKVIIKALEESLETIVIRSSEEVLRRFNGNSVRGLPGQYN